MSNSNDNILIIVTTFKNQSEVSSSGSNVTNLIPNNLRPQTEVTHNSGDTVNNIIVNTSTPSSLTVTPFLNTTNIIATTEKTTVLIASPLGPSILLGSQGIQGIQGNTGATGADSTVAGPRGATGVTGNTGADSTVAGPRGATGVTGATGYGFTGAIVTDGYLYMSILYPDGVVGSLLPVGYVRGNTGNTGSTGADSTVAGPRGATGATGTVQGVSAANGLTGAITWAAGTGLSVSSEGKSITYGIGTGYALLRSVGVSAELDGIVGQTAGDLVFVRDQGTYYYWDYYFQGSTYDWINISVISNALQGDLNNDGRVNGADLGILLSNWGLAYGQKAFAVGVQDGITGAFKIFADGSANPKKQDMVLVSTEGITSEFRVNTDNLYLTGVVQINGEGEEIALEVLNGSTHVGNLVVGSGIDVYNGLNFVSGGISGGFINGGTSSFTGLVSSTVGFSGSGTNLTNIVTSVNGLTGAIFVNKFTEGITTPSINIPGDRWLNTDTGFLYTSMTGVSGFIWVQL